MNPRCGCLQGRTAIPRFQANVGTLLFLVVARLIAFVSLPFDMMVAVIETCIDILLLNP